MRRIVTVATYFEDVLGTPIDDAPGSVKAPGLSHLVRVRERMRKGDSRSGGAARECRGSRGGDRSDRSFGEPYRTSVHIRIGAKG